MKHHIPENIPLILVGTQVDLRQDEQIRKELMERKLSPITEEQGESLRKKVNAQAVCKILRSILIFTVLGMFCKDENGSQKSV